MTEYLFSYGTLQPDLAPPEIAPLVRTFRYLERGHVHGVLYDFGDYPGAVLDKQAGEIWGHVFVLPQGVEVLQRLDEYEEFYRTDPAQSQFIRTECKVLLEAGSEVFAWFYAYNRDPSSAPVIAGGDYAKSRALRSS